MSGGEGRKILCALDVSEHSQRTLDEAVLQAEKFSGELIILHVLNEGRFEDLVQWQGRIPYMDDELVKQAFKTLGDEREAALKEMLGRSEVDRVPHTTIITRGYPTEEILKAAEEHQVELIVMGIKGRGSLFRQLVIGSRAEKVFERSTTSVLFVR